MTNDFKAQTVLDAMRKDGGCVSFCDLEETTGMGAVELSLIVGMLAKENRILMRLNHSKSDTYVYKSNGDALYEQFRDLLFIYRGRQRSVSFYAAQLCITSKYLCAIVKKASGRTPLEWINQETIKEIEQRLCHTQSSIKNIVYELGFPNMSSFGKFFKAHKGMSPKFYRMRYCAY